MDNESLQSLCEGLAACQSNCRSEVLRHLAGSEVRWSAQEKQNQRMEDGLKEMHLRLSCLEKKVAKIVAAAAVIGSLLGGVLKTLLLG